MTVPLPLGWVINEVLEEVPSPNAGTPAAGYFARKTFICYDENNQYVCSSGSREDCENQALTAAQSSTQQNFY
jgi:hypothetical protein